MSAKRHANFNSNPASGKQSKFSHSEWSNSEEEDGATPQVNHFPNTKGSLGKQNKSKNNFNSNSEEEDGATPQVNHFPNTNGSIITPRPTRTHENSLMNIGVIAINGNYRKAAVTPTSGPLMGQRGMHFQCRVNGEWVPCDTSGKVHNEYSEKTKVITGNTGGLIGFSKATPVTAETIRKSIGTASTSTPSPTANLRSAFSNVAATPAVSTNTRRPLLRRTGGKRASRKGRRHTRRHKKTKKTRRVGHRH